MANENAKIVRQQGGSELSVRSAGSLNIESGGKLSTAGTQNISSGGSLTVAAGAALMIGTVRIETGGSNPNHAGSPGDIYIVSNGVASNWFVNQASGVSGKTWASGVEAI